MTSERTHRVTTADGVTTGGTVHGQGPPIVFLHGVIGDGDLDWRPLLPHLTDRFTCHLPSMRGRGLSGDHPDLGPGRAVEDFLAYVESIGEPTGLVGWSGGATQALAVAARSEVVDAVAPYEPVVNRVLDEREQAELGDAVARMGELAAGGRWADAARALAGFPFTDADIAVAEDAGYFEAAGRYVPNTLNFFRQLGEHEGPRPDDPAVLRAISVPVLVLVGSDTKPYAVRSARYVTDHVPHARTREIPGAGHAGPLTRPEALAEALTEFFSPARPTA